jgi:outer membrane protein OmpA-like peptidoglycan-associated protein
MAVQDLIQQSVSQDADHGQFSGTGITNYRGYGKLNLLERSSSSPVGVATILTGVFNNVRNNPLVGKGGSPVGVWELAVDTKLAGLALAGNVGYRFRKKGDPIGTHLEPMGNQYIASAGMSYLLPSFDTKLIMEVFGSRPAQSTNTSIELRQSSSAELIGGIKFDATTNLAVHAGGGTELIRGAATPDWRLYAGIDWAIGPLVHHEPRREPPLQKTDEADDERAVLHNIHFATGSDKVPPEAEAELTELAQQLQSAPYDHISVEGHTDSVGSVAFNQRLSERRAGTVREWLIEHAHIDPKRIEAIGYGPTRPIADNGNFQGRQRNRRVEVVVKRHGKVLEKTSDTPKAPDMPAPSGDSGTP